MTGIPSQTIELSLIGGINEKEDSVLSQNPSELVNFRYAKTGAVSKRNGFETAGPYNLRSNGDVPPEGEMLCELGDELVRIGGSEVDSFQNINNTSEWVFKDRVSECIGNVYMSSYARTQVGYLADPAVAVAAGHVITVYADSQGTNFSIIANVKNQETGAEPLSRFVVWSSLEAQSTPKIVVLGTTVGVFWHDAFTQGILARFLDMTTLTWGPVGWCAPVQVETSNPNFDVGVLDDDHWVLAGAAPMGGGTQVWAIKRVQTTPDFWDQTWTTVTAASDFGLQGISLRVVPGENVWVAMCSVVGNRIWVLTTAGASFAGPFTSDATQGIRIGLERVTAASYMVAWTVVSDGTYWREIELSGTTLSNVDATPKYMRDVMMLSRPLVRLGRSYLLIMNATGNFASHFLIDLALGGTIPDGGTARLVGVATPLQLAAVRTETAHRDEWTGNYFSRFYSTSNWATDSEQNVLYVASTCTTENADSARVIALEWKFDSAWTRTATQIGNVLIISGGVVSQYDGTQCFELSFAWQPDMFRIASFTSSASTGFLDSSKAYGYRYVYAFTDGRGNVHRSAPSLAKTVGLTPGDNTLHGTVPPLHLSNKFDGGPTATPILIEIYRTEGNGSQYYYLKSINNVPNSGPIAFTDIMSDTDLTAVGRARFLYTEGNALERTIPPSASIVSSFKNSIILGGTDDDSIYFSGENTAGVGLWFNGTMSQVAFEGGTVEALASLDATLIVGKSRAIYYIQGEPPANDGTSTLTVPLLIQSDVGMISSITGTIPDGLLFQSSHGLYLLQRGLAVSPIGKGVEDSYTGHLAAICVLPRQSIARFVQQGVASNANCLNLDYFHSQGGAPVWSKDSWIDIIPASITPFVVAACMWRGSFVYMTDTGFLYRESDLQFYDSDASGNKYFVQSRFGTAFAKPRGPQGYHRVKEVSVLGDYGSRHNLTVSLESDLGSNTLTWTADDIDAMAGDEQVQVQPHFQKVQRMRVVVSDSYPTEAVAGDGSGVTIRSICVEVAAKTKPGRIAAIKRK